MRLNLDDLAMAIGQGIQEGIRPLLSARDQGEALIGELVEQLKRQADASEALTAELRRQAKTAELEVGELQRRVAALEAENRGLKDQLARPWWKRRG